MRPVLHLKSWIRTSLLGVMLAIGLAFGAWATAARAADTLYWTAGDPSTGLVSGNLDGTGSVTTVTVGTQTKSGVAIDFSAGKIYWAEGWSGEIRWTWLNNSANTYRLFASQYDAAALAIDPVAGKLYWTINRDNTGEIRVGNLNGNGTPTALFTNLDMPTGLAIDPQGGTMYWAEYGGDKVVAGNLDGSYSPWTLYSGETGPVAVAVDHATGRLYWTNGGNAGTIRKGTINGASDPPVTLYTESWPIGLALDPGTNSLYWTTIAGKGIRVGTLDGLGTVQNRFTNTYAADYLAIARAPVGTGAPTITGTPRIGQPLTCSRGGWAGDLLGSLLYRVPTTYVTQWLRGSTVVASTSTYTPTAAGTLTCSVTAGNHAGSATQTSTAVVVPAPPTASITAPSNNQTYRVGQSVTTTFGCTKGNPGGTITSCVDSNGTAAPTGHLNTSTPGKGKTYTVTATSSDGLTGTATITYNVAAPPSVTITAPPNHETYQVYDAVSTSFTCSEGTGGPGIQSCVDSNGEMSPGSLYTEEPGDWTYTVTATSLDGQTASASISYSVTEEDEPPPTRTPPVNAALPAISGTAKIGSRLTASPGRWTGTAPIAYQYQWQRCTNACTAITSATSSTYTVTAADAGATLRVGVLAVNRAGRASATSRAVGPVPRVGPSGPTTAQIKAALLKELAPYGKAAKLGNVLRKRGYAYDCRALTRGVMTISWYQVPKGAHLSRTPKPVLIATGRRSFTRAGHAHMTIKLTKAGTSLLKRSRQVKLSAKASFARTGAAQVSAIKVFSLKR